MFRQARLKLTAWYLLIIMLVSISFSMVIYKALMNEVDRFARMQKSRIERRFRVTPLLPSSDPELIEEIQQHLIFTLIVVNGGIFILSGALGYLLAGRTLKPIKEMLEEQNRFISDASHELRTPLTSIKSALEVNLRDSHLTLKDARTLMAESIDEVNKLQSLSNGLLQLAQYQKPNGHTSFAPLSLGEIVKKAIHKTELLAKEKKIWIKDDVQDETVEGEKEGLIDALVILLDNAIKYSKPKTTIEISSRTTDGFVDIAVSDHGIGINAKDIPHIFDRFYRADAARSQVSGGGYGLGLPIAKKIIDLHHGLLTVQSQPEQGSTFTMRLPRRQNARLKTTFFS